jgi:malate dehydrogenase
VVRDLTEEIADICPNAFLLVIANPVNSIIPIVAETLKSAHVFTPKRLFGITTLDVVRASTFVAEVAGLSPTEVAVPVVGGHSNNTIVPLLSQTKPGLNLDDERLRELTIRIQSAGDEVIHAKSGRGSATLCMAYAGYRSAHFVMELISDSPIQ